MTVGANWTRTSCPPLAKPLIVLCSSSTYCGSMVICPPLPIVRAVIVLDSIHMNCRASSEMFPSDPASAEMVEEWTKRSLRLVRSMFPPAPADLVEMSAPMLSEKFPATIFTSPPAFCAAVAAIEARPVIVASFVMVSVTLPAAPLPVLEADTIAPRSARKLPDCRLMLPPEP